jgi:hypothetical protein
MHKGTPIREFVTRAQELHEQNVDVLAPAYLSSVVLRESGGVELAVKDNANSDSMSLFELNDHALRQVEGFAGIPLRYADRMKAEAPDLYQHNVNTWLDKSDATRMIRTRGGVMARAYLSDRYKRLDHLPVLDKVGGELLSVGAIIESAEITDQKMYLKAVLPNTRRDLPVRQVGDTVEAGIMVSNSEIGSGALTVTAFMHRLVCLNGMVVSDVAGKLRIPHFGGRLDNAALSSESEQAAMTASLLQARDAVRALASGEWLDNLGDIFGRADRRVLEEPGKAVQTMAKTYGWSETEQQGLISRLIQQGGEPTVWSLANAVTNLAQSVESYDRSTELEAQGWDVVQGVGMNQVAVAVI